MLNSFTLLCSTPISTFSTDFLQERWIFVVNPQHGQRLNWPMSFFYGSLAQFFVPFHSFQGWPAGGGHEWLGSRHPWRTCFFKRQLYEEVTPGNLTYSY